MANKFDFLTKELAEQAANIIDSEGIPPRRESRDYSVQIGSNSYPYKLLVTKAAELSDIELLPNDFSSNPANRVEMPVPLTTTSRNRLTTKIQG